MNKSQIKQRVIDQQYDAKMTIPNQKLVKRDQLSTLLELLETQMIKVIMGIRRCGKSTLALQAVQNKKFIYYNFDDEVLSQLKSESLQELIDIGLELEPEVSFFVFDEIQNIDGWEFFINRLHRQKKNLIITGSNSRLLSSELSSHLTGRQLSISIFPFSFNEYLLSSDLFFKKPNFSTDEARELSIQFDRYMSQSSFPELMNLDPKSSFSKKYLIELYEKIIFRDVVQRRNIKNIKLLKEISLLLLSQYSQKMTYQSIKRILGVSSLSTVKNYIEYVTETYLIFILDPYSEKTKVRISLPKKIYTIETLWADHYISGSQSNSGRKLENLIYLQLLRCGLEIYYIHDNEFEIDFAIKKGRKISSLIQVCWSLENLETRQREIKALVKAYRQHKNAKLMIITHNEEETITYDQLIIQAIPAWKFCLTQDFEL